MSEKEKILLRRRPFTDHLADAIRQSGLARIESAPPDLRNAGAKASILQCVFALEALVNSMIEDLAFSKRLRDAVDRFQALEKYEFCVHHINGLVLDRGSPKVQAVAELFKIRNDYVHPKVSHIEGDFLIDENVMDYPEEVYPHLGIPIESRRWNYGATKSALLATDGFIDHLFFDLLDFEPERIISVLLPLMVTSEGPKFAMVLDNRDAFIKAKERMGLSLRYFSLDRPLNGEILDAFGATDQERAEARLRAKPLDDAPE